MLWLYGKGTGIPTSATHTGALASLSHREEITTTQEVLLVLYLNIDSYGITGSRTTSQCISTFCVCDLTHTALNRAVFKELGSAT